MNIPIMLKLPENDRLARLVPLSMAMFVVNLDNIIGGVICDGELCDELESTTGQFVKIADLNCKSYEELIVKLELNSLLHGVVKS